jgi:hypothetical protein
MRIGVHVGDEVSGEVGEKREKRIEKRKMTTEEEVRPRAPVHRGVCKPWV